MPGSQSHGDGYREILPHPALRAHVDRFWISVSGTPVPARRILPDGCIDLLIDLGDGCTGQALAVGTMTAAVVFDPRSPLRIAAVRFRPGGAVPFLGVAASELTDRTFPAEEIGARWLAHAPWCRRPSDRGDPAAAVASLERLLLGRLAAARNPPDALVAHAVAALSGPAPPSIEALGRETGWSRQHLARAFRFHVGVGPKRLARVARLQRAIIALQAGRPDGGRRDSLAGTALGLGYFDQAHMTGEFQALAGITPRQARRAGGAAGSIFPIRSLFDAG